MSPLDPFLFQEWFYGVATVSNFQAGKSGLGTNIATVELTLKCETGQTSLNPKTYFFADCVYTLKPYGYTT